MSVYLKLIWAYLKIGLFGFGGGYAMLALIEREVVNPGWITEQMFTDIVAISQMTPGPIGINSATYIGYVVTGSVWGSVVTTLTVMLPSFLLVLYASHFIHRHKDSEVIKVFRRASSGSHRAYRLGGPPADEPPELPRQYIQHTHLCGVVPAGILHEDASDMDNLSGRPGRISDILLIDFA